MSLTDLTTNMDQFKKDGPADVKLSTDVKNSYVTLIKGFRDKMQATLDKVDHDGMADLGNVGTMGSANQTKRNLLLDAANFKETIKQYIDYLDAFEATVNKAAERLIKNG
jgi:hypothetical protein